MLKSTKKQTLKEEIANSISHGIGLALAITGLAFLVVLACHRGNSWHIVSCSIYGGTLVLLYLSSTLYHAVPYPKAKTVLKTIDHCTIYLLIAGSYTPFTLVTLQGGWGWSLFGTVWALAIVGIIFKLYHTGKYEFISTAVYLLMGWLVVIAIKPIYTELSSTGFAWLLAGGLAYSFGVVFYLLDHRVRYFHTVWHVFVLAGSICHFFAILLYVLPTV